MEHIVNLKYFAEPFWKGLGLVLTLFSPSPQLFKLLLMDFILVLVFYIYSLQTRKQRKINKYSKIYDLFICQPPNMLTSYIPLNKMHLKSE